MRESSLLVLAVALCALSACQKNSAEDTAPQLPTSAPALAPISTYSLLDSGNYWVYQHYKVDSTDAILEIMGVDSFWVAGDSVLGGETWTVVRRRTNGGSNSVFLWRDSLDYLINSMHDVLFCSEPLDMVISSVYQGPYGVIIDYTVHSEPVAVTVAAGTFDANMMRAEYTSIGGYPEVPDWKRLRSYWAENVGRVRYYLFYGSTPFGYRYDLTNYQVN